MNVFIAVCGGVLFMFTLILIGFLIGFIFGQEIGKRTEREEIIKSLLQAQTLDKQT